MQSQFTDKAQNALAQAGRCARGLKQGYIGTEHILVGLLKEDTGVAAKVLADNGVEVDQIMEMIRDLIAFENGVAQVALSGKVVREDVEHHVCVGDYFKIDKQGKRVTK